MIFTQGSCGKRSSVVYIVFGSLLKPRHFPQFTYLSYMKLGDDCWCLSAECF